MQRRSDLRGQLHRQGSSRSSRRKGGTGAEYRKLQDDLCDAGEVICPNRVARLARLTGIQAQIRWGHTCYETENGRVILQVDPIENRELTVRNRKALRRAPKWPIGGEIGKLNTTAASR